MNASPYEALAAQQVAEKELGEPPLVMTPHVALCVACAGCVLTIVALQLLCATFWGASITKASLEAALLVTAAAAAVWVTEAANFLLSRVDGDGWCGQSRLL